MLSNILNNLMPPTLLFIDKSCRSFIKNTFDKIFKYHIKYDDFT